MQVYLRKHGPGTALHTIKAECERKGELIKLDFTVQKRSSAPWVTDSAFTNDWSRNWGLWNKDVVEAFLQLRKDPMDTNAPYLEVQVSPLGQPFALVITEPRKSFFGPKFLSFSSHVQVEGRSWKASLQVELPSEVLGGSLLYGGFFACLSSDPREYYALEPNPEEQPDFHRPELFLPFDQ
jgi:hypothetical protein